MKKITILNIQSINTVDIDTTVSTKICFAKKVLNTLLDTKMMIMMIKLHHIVYNTFKNEWI